MRKGAIYALKDARRAKISLILNVAVIANKVHIKLLCAAAYPCNR